jgi:hypothetical protein
MLVVIIAALMQASGSLPVRSIDRGVRSGIDAPEQVVVHTTQEWTELWRRHGSSRPLPPVDFDREMVVAVFAGTRPTAGYAVTITAARAQGDGLVVEYAVKAPSPGSMTAQVLTSPYAIAALPRHAGGVRFEEMRN